MGTLSTRLGESARSAESLRDYPQSGVVSIDHWGGYSPNRNQQMQLLISSQSIERRPRGVSAISGLLAATGLMALVFAFLSAVSMIPLSYGALLLQGGLEQRGPIAFLLYASIAFTLAWGLWSQHGWARRLTVLLAGIGIALGVPSVSSAVVDGRPFSIVREGLQIMVRVAVIYYLSQEPTRDWFAARQR